jgi:hypothetical protein
MQAKGEIDSPSYALAMPTACLCVRVWMQGMHFMLHAKDMRAILHDALTFTDHPTLTTPTALSHLVHQFKSPVRRNGRRHPQNTRTPSREGVCHALPTPRPLGAASCTAVFS